MPVANEYLVYHTKTLLGKDVEYREFTGKKKFSWARLHGEFYSVLYLLGDILRGKKLMPVANEYLVYHTKTLLGRTAEIREFFEKKKKKKLGKFSWTRLHGKFY